MFKGSIVTIMAAVCCSLLMEVQSDIQTIHKENPMKIRNMHESSIISGTVFYGLKVIFDNTQQIYETGKHGITTVYLVSITIAIMYKWDFKFFEVCSYYISRCFHQYFIQNSEYSQNISFQLVIDKDSLKDDVLRLSKSPKYVNCKYKKEANVKNRDQFKLRCHSQYLLNNKNGIYTKLVFAKDSIEDVVLRCSKSTKDVIGICKTDVNVKNRDGLRIAVDVRNVLMKGPGIVVCEKGSIRTGSVRVIRHGEPPASTADIKEVDSLIQTAQTVAYNLQDNINNLVLHVIPASKFEDAMRELQIENQNLVYILFHAQACSYVVAIPIVEGSYLHTAAVKEGRRIIPAHRGRNGTNDSSFNSKDRMMNP